MTGQQRMAERLLKYALNNEALVSVEDVPSGLKCGCVCPSCGCPLIAKKGEKREHHFAHKSWADCNHGCESALHLMAKRILSERKELFVPDIDNADTGSIKAFEKVELESREFSSFVPDVVMRNKGDILCVEILVTHAVDEEKETKIAEARVPTVEIDLYDLLDEYDEAAVTAVLLSGENTEWIFNKSIENQHRMSLIAGSLCDLLPPANENSDWFNCIYQKKRVHFLLGGISCHECWYLNSNYPSDYNEIMPCNYRERNLLKLNIDDCRNVNRVDGRILSVEMLIDGEWQLWKGGFNETLSKVPGNLAERELRKRRCCIITSSIDTLLLNVDKLTALIDSDIRRAIYEGFVTFISGLDGLADIVAAEIVLQLRDSGRPIHLICALPYSGYKPNLPVEFEPRFAEVLNRCDLSREISKEPKLSSMRMRNEWIVDHSSQMICIHDGEPGTVQNAIDYADRCRIEIIQHNVSIEKGLLS